MTFEEVLKVIKEYNPEEIDRVKKAYKLAEEAHKDQKRESGEPYIIHPINVCMNLAELYADGDSLCAGLLHDVVEDTDVTLEMIEKEFGSSVAHLVDGVTKISNLHYSSKDEATNANIRRLINSLNDDVRIIIIKLCDRLHNIRTLEFKAPEKRVRSAYETINIFAPLAYFIGLFRMKCELEDKCLYYIDEEAYDVIKSKEQEILLDYEKCLNITTDSVKKILDEHNIKYEFRIKILNVYQIYQKLNKGYKYSDIHDLVNYKIMVDKEEECYLTLGLLHKLYTPMNYKFKDYIALPKTNRYKSLHTTVFGPDNHILQFQIKTKEMDEINTYGLTAYWRQLREGGQEKMQMELVNNYPFFNVLRDLNQAIDNDTDFVDRVKQEIFTQNIYVYSLNGEIVELPYGSTVIDFAYKIHTEIGNHLYKAYINGKEVKITKVLSNKDRIMLLQNENSYPRKSWINHVVTLNAKRKIKEFLKDEKEGN